MTRRIVGTVASLGAVLVLLALPVASGGQTGVGLADDVVKQVQDTVDPVAPDVLPQAQPAPPAPAQPAPPAPAQPPVQGQGTTPGSPGGYQPPLHGANPHGQGTVGVVDLAPSATRPLSPDPAGGEAQDQEEVVVGRARGEEDAQGFHGHVTVLALLGEEVVGVDSRPGQSTTGPLEAVQEGVLDALCNGTAEQICLEVLQADSTTTDNSSTNQFAVARADVGGPGGISATAASSEGNLSEDSNCQTATGSSTVLDTSVGGTPLADAATSSSQTTSCRDGSGSQANSSRVIGLVGQPLELPAPGCGSGTPDTVTGIPAIAPIVCNADDTLGMNETLVQAAERYGVREALTVFALDVGGTSLLKTTTAASESLAQAPAEPAAPPAGPVGPVGPRGPGGRRGPVGKRGPEGPRADRPTRPGPGEPRISGPVGGPVDGPDSPDDVRTAGPSLPFTGANLLLLLLVGSATLLAGLGLYRATGRAGGLVGGPPRE